MFVIICEVCKEELHEPGALLMGPPENTTLRSKNIHICVQCYVKVLNLLLDLRAGKRKDYFA